MEEIKRFKNEKGLGPWFGRKPPGVNLSGVKRSGVTGEDHKKNKCPVPKKKEVQKKFNVGGKNFFSYSVPIIFFLKYSLGN